MVYTERYNRVRSGYTVIRAWPRQCCLELTLPISGKCLLLFVPNQEFFFLSYDLYLKS